MSTIEEGHDNAKVSHTTQIGSVTGQVHTGSGNITVGNFLVSNSVSTKDEFLSALREFKEEIKKGHQNGLPEDVMDDVTIEIEAAEKEVQKETPKLERVMKRLKNTKGILVETAGVATATRSVIKATNALMPYIEKVIEFARNVF